MPLTLFTRFKHFHIKRKLSRSPRREVFFVMVWSISTNAPL